mgnify:CR=1 FL=1
MVNVFSETKLSIFDRVKKLFGNKWVNYEYVLGSHNVEKGSESQGFYSTDVWRTIADQYDIQNKLWKYVKEYYTPERLGSGIVIYGEIYGHGIQKNYDYGLSDIRFAGFVNDKSQILHSAQQKDLDSLLTDNEIGMSIHYTLERWRKAQNFTFRLGKERLTLTEYDNVTLFTIPFKGKLLLVSTEPRIHYDPIIEKVNSILTNWEK